MDRILTNVDAGQLMASIGTARFRPFHAVTFAACTFVTIVEGFDTQIVAFVAPLLIRDFHVAPAALGFVFSAALVGLMAGSLLVGPLGDRFGRKPLIIATVGLVGVFTLCTAAATSIEQIVLFRFLTGVGLGATLPNVIALTTEFAPVRLRALIVTMMFCGFPIGASGGAILVAQFVDWISWRAIFVIGGVLPIMLALALVPMLPESLYFLFKGGGRGGRGERTLRRIVSPAECSEILAAAAAGGIERAAPAAALPLASLFTKGRRALTLTVWLAFFCNMLVSYLLVNWLPTLLEAKGIALKAAIGASIAFNVGAILGSIVIASVIARRGARAGLAPAYGLALLVIPVLGRVEGAVPILLTIFAAGATAFGAQFCLNALAATYYPSGVRATGLGWALGVGRTGAIAGPLMGSWLLAAGFSLQTIFMLAALPMIVCGAAVLALAHLAPSPLP